MTERTGLAKQMRDTACALEGEFTADRLCDLMGIGTGSEERMQIRKALPDFLKRGEIERVSKGVYRYAGRRPEAPLNKRNIMWRFLRARKVVGVEELQAVAEVPAVTAREWLQALVRLGHVQRGEDCYRLIDDPFDMPVGDLRTPKAKGENAERRTKAVESQALREVREHLDRTKSAIQQAAAAMEATQEALYRTLATLAETAAGWRGE